jgi:hypothetical protein
VPTDASVFLLFRCVRPCRYLSMWYLMGWLLLLCGVPAGLLGRKRLPSGPWGPAYLEVLKATKSSGEGRAERERLRGVCIVLRYTNPTSPSFSVVDAGTCHFAF